MFDIRFFQAVQPLKEEIVRGRRDASGARQLAEAFERLVAQRPFVFNIETTNACNMKCVMCPRTKLMTRSIGHMDHGLFLSLLDQIVPHTPAQIETFHAFVRERYGVQESDPHEDAFYFYVIATHLILHGYGEPLLDPQILERVRACTERKIPTYFSCVPANIRLDLFDHLMDAGLGVVKFSLDALDDETQKKIRGSASDFSSSFEKILALIELRAKRGYKTKFAVQQIQFAQDAGESRSAERFMEMWRQQPVFAYLKSQDNRWFFEEDAEVENRSHLANQYCEWPWTSLTVMADGSVVPCTQDYNTEMKLGDATRHSLATIWLSEPYRRFRAMHLTGKFPAGHKCAERCDWRKAHALLKEESHG